MEETFTTLSQAKSYIILMTITMGKVFVEQIVKIKQDNRDLIIVAMVWKLPHSGSDENLIADMITAGICVLQMDVCVQHIKCIIVDNNIVTNGGSANLSFRAYNGLNQGEYNIYKKHNHDEFELRSMILTTLLGFDVVVKKLNV